MSALRVFFHRHGWIFIPIGFSFTYFHKLGEASLWYDELQTWYPITLVKFEYFWNQYRVRETAPPLFYVLNYWIHQIIPASEMSLRMISALSMSICNIFLFYFLRRWFGWLVATAVLFFVITNGYMIGFAQLARSYGLFTLSATLSFLIAVQIVRDGRNRSSELWLFASLSVGLLTHYYGAVVLGAIVIWIMMMSREKKEIFKKFAVILALPLILFLYFVLTQRLVSHLTFVQQPRFEALLQISELLFSDPTQSALLNFGLLFLLARILIRQPHPWDPVLGYILFYNLLVFSIVSGISLIKPIYSLRYVTFVTPTHALFLSLLTVSACENLFQFLKSSRLKAIAVRTTVLSCSVLFAGSQLWHRKIYPEHYSPVATYPLRQALEATIDFHRNSNHAKEEIEFIVEENSPESVRLYFPQFGLDDIGILVPSDSVAKKNADFAKSLPLADATIVYLLKVFTAEFNQEYNEIKVNGWRPIHVFSQDRVSVYGFEKIGP